MSAAPWLNNLHLDSVARGEVELMSCTPGSNEYLPSNGSNNQNYEEAQITETLKKGTLITADLLDGGHKSLAEVH